MESLRPRGRRPAALPTEDLAARKEAREIGVFTTARVTAGRVRYLERHVARLCRDAAASGLAPLDPIRIRRALCELAARSPHPEAIARLAAIAGAGRELRLAASLHPVESDAPEREWSAVSAIARHPGARPGSGCKSCERALCDEALASARAAGADEALLFDAADRLVEGARSNLCFALAGAALATPPLARGAVAGVAREIARARVPELAERDLARAELGRLRELIAVNAVRGAVAITRVDGAPVGTGRPGPWARRLADALAAEAELG